MSTGTILADFFETTAADPRIGTTHIAVYLALVNIWQQRNFPTQLEVTSCEIMSHTGIRSRVTVLRCMRAMHSFGYLDYQPAENEIIKASVRFKKL